MNILISVVYFDKLTDSDRAKMEKLQNEGQGESQYLHRLNLWLFSAHMDRFFSGKKIGSIIIKLKNDYTEDELHEAVCEQLKLDRMATYRPETTNDKKEG